MKNAHEMLNKITTSNMQAVWKNIQYSNRAATSIHYIERSDAREMSHVVYYILLNL